MSKDQPVPDETFRRFADRLAGGERDAASELLARYAVQLVGLARRRLGTRLRSKEDPEDVLQSVMRTFFRRLDAGEVELRDWGSLWGFLSLATLRKCQRRSEHYGAARRNARREVSIADTCETAGITIPDRGPTPDEVTVFADEVESILAKLDGRDRDVVELMLAGESAADIAKRLNCSDRSVYRTVARLRQRLAKDHQPPTGHGTEGEATE